MLATFLITWRETIEAALIVGILLTFLHKIGQRKYFKTIYWGVGWAILASLAFAAASNLLAVFLEGDGEAIAEIGILFLATIVLTHMVVWMHHNAREIKGELQQQAEAAIAKSRLWALGMVAFIGVFREGIETVLFIWGLFLQGAAGESVGGAIAGGFIGVALGIGMAWVFFKGFGHLDLRIFFRISGIILLFMAAGMLSSGIGKLIANGWFPGLIEPVWNTSWLLSERSLVGSLVSGLFGYRSSPSLMQMLFYLLYFPVTIYLLRRQHHDLAQ